MATDQAPTSVVSIESRAGRRHAKRQFIRERVLELISSLGPGAAIPPERDLALELRVSRMTLRRALDDLVVEGRLVRRQGSGTFVGEAKISHRLRMISFSEDMKARGHVPGSRTLSISTIVAGARLGRRLNVSPSDRVIQIVRLRLADNQPMAIETLHVPHSMVPDLTGDELEDASFYELLERRFGIVVESGIQTIQPTVTTETESAILRVPLNSPAFLFEHSSLATTGETVEYVRSVFRGDRYQLTAELTRSGRRIRHDPGAAATDLTAKQLADITST